MRRQLRFLLPLQAKIERARNRRRRSIHLAAMACGRQTNPSGTCRTTACTAQATCRESRRSASPTSTGLSAMGRPRCGAIQRKAQPGSGIWPAKQGERFEQKPAVRPAAAQESSEPGHLKRFLQKVPSGGVWPHKAQDAHKGTRQSCAFWRPYLSNVFSQEETERTEQDNALNLKDTKAQSTSTGRQFSSVSSFTIAEMQASCEHHSPVLFKRLTTDFLARLRRNQMGRSF